MSSAIVTRVASKNPNDAAHSAGVPVHEVFSWSLRKSTRSPEAYKRITEVPSGVYAVSSIAPGEYSSRARNDCVLPAEVARMRIRLRSGDSGDSEATGV